VIVEAVWTADEQRQAKTVFQPGEEIRYMGEFFNNGSVTVEALLTWEVTGPCGTIDYYAGLQPMSSGRETWELPSTLPADTCGGIYLYRLSATYNGSTSTLAAPFTVLSSITPTPTQPATQTTLPPHSATPTRTPTPSRTPTSTVTGTLPASEGWRVYLPLLSKESMEQGFDQK
jgi:hypothetical protein